MKRGDSLYREVYSTAHGEVCRECQAPKSKCTCAERKRARALGDGNVRVRRESKGRGGKTVTTITGLSMAVAQAEGLLKRLKTLCGTGGTIKDGVLELQGDRCEVVLAELLKQGIRAKRAGG